MKKKKRTYMDAFCAFCPFFFGGGGFILLRHLEFETDHGVQAADYKLEMKQTIVTRNCSKDTRGTTLLDEIPARTLRKPEL